MKIFFSVILSALCGYLLGSVNTAIVLSRLVYHQDIRSFGSGNAGMTNVLRTYGKKMAALTFIGDFFKGVAAVFLARLIFSLFGVTAFDGAYIGGLFVILGHLYPVFFGFRGGKGIATSIGVISVLNFWVFLALVAIGLPLIFITKIVSVGSLVGAVCFPVLTLIFDLCTGGIDWVAFAFSVGISLLVIWMHRGNVKRLINGTESRFGTKKEPPR